MDPNLFYMPFAWMKLSYELLYIYERGIAFARDTPERSELSAHPSHISSPIPRFLKSISIQPQTKEPWLLLACSLGNVQK